MPGMKLFSVLVQRTTQHVISLLFIFLRPSSSLHASGYDCGQGMKVKGKGTAKSWETPRSIVKKEKEKSGPRWREKFGINFAATTDDAARLLACMVD